MTLLKTWHSLLQEVEFARNYWRVYALDAPLLGPSGRNEVVDKSLPSLLYIKLGCILDEGAISFLDGMGITNIPKPYNNDLNGRLKYLEDNSKLLDALALRDIRKKRNSVAHEDVRVSWPELDQAIASVHSQLQAWGFVGDRPVYQFHAERSQAKAVEEEGVLVVWEYRVGLETADRVEWKYGWTKKLYKAV